MSCILLCMTLRFHGYSGHQSPDLLLRSTPPPEEPKARRRKRMLLIDEDDIVLSNEYVNVLSSD